MEDGDINILARQVSKRLKYQMLLEDPDHTDLSASLGCEPTALEVAHTSAVFDMLSRLGFEIRVKA